ncbi:hypothetical protein [Rhizobium sp. WYJ-E13]|uniref:hypothetical protein n=1 Tax=Rhizobium sp. WYJ-E13 TaxID=2849093 RepID=UPI001C1EEA79|nr:hypothetical protein [Rhizobium sp. WYJ-E13]QWW72311.1 hypothetical protein KQ933_32575 [Rhizobium sp. WYJ-E13]
MAKKKQPISTPTKDVEAQEQDDYLEEALEETFPASDPISPGRAGKGHRKDPSPAR